MSNDRIISKLFHIPVKYIACSDTKAFVGGIPEDA